MSAKFVIVGSRVINLRHVAAAERDGNRGRVTVHLAGGFTWTFDKTEEADLIWSRITAERHDMTDLGGGPESITDNQTTASRQRRD